MSVKFIFPPFSEFAIRGPHLAAPLLSAILNSHNYKADYYDFNIQFVREISKAKYVNQAIELLKIKNSTKCQQEVESLLNFINFDINFFSESTLPGFINILKILKKCFFTNTVSFEECFLKIPFQDACIEDIFIKLIQDIGIETNDIVGISVAFADQLSSSVFIAKKIKQLFPDVKIILGGSQISLLNINQINYIKDSNLFSEIVQGDADGKIVNIIERLSTGSDSILENSQIHLNQLPTPEFKDIHLYFGTLQIPIQVTKGCYWGKCTFCDYIKLVDSGKTHFWERNPEIVFNLILEYRKKWPHCVVNLISDAVPPVWYQKLCNLAIQSGTKLNTWSYMLHSKILTRSLFETYSKAGIHSITFGTESLLDRQLKILNKNADSETIFQNLIDSFHLGFSVFINIIPDIPTTTFLEANILYNEIEKIVPYIHFLNIQNFDLTSGTHIAENPDSYGIEIIKSENIKSSHGYHSLKFNDCKGMTPSEKHDIGNKLNFLTLKVRLDSLIQSLLSKNITLENTLLFDPSLTLFSNTQFFIYSGSFNIMYKLHEWEYKMFQNIFKLPHREVIMEKLNIFYKTHHISNTISFNNYFLSILHRGFILNTIQIKV